jgi:hypothetical protein
MSNYVPVRTKRTSSSSSSSSMKSNPLTSLHESDV